MIITTMLVTITFKKYKNIDPDLPNIKFYVVLILEHRLKRE